MVVEGIAGARVRVVRRPGVEPVGVWLLIALTGLGWGLVATMRFWWSWLWARLGLISVPVDTLVWILALILTILVTPVLWRRFRRTGVVAFVVGTVLVGGTCVVLSPWHDVLTQAWIRMECGPGDCVNPAPPPASSWRIEKPR